MRDSFHYLVRVAIEDLLCLFQNSQIRDGNAQIICVSITATYLTIFAMFTLHCLSARKSLINSLPNQSLPTTLMSDTDLPSLAIHSVILRAVSPKLSCVWPRFAVWLISPFALTPIMSQTLFSFVNRCNSSAIWAPIFTLFRICISLPLISLCFTSQCLSVADWVWLRAAHLHIHQREYDSLFSSFVQKSDLFMPTYITCLS